MQAVIPVAGPCDTTALRVITGMQARLIVMRSNPSRRTMRLEACKVLERVPLRSTRCETGFGAASELPPTETCGLARLPRSLGHAWRFNGRVRILAGRRVHAYVSRIFAAC